MIGPESATGDGIVSAAIHYFFSRDQGLTSRVGDLLVMRVHEMLQRALEAAGIVNFRHQLPRRYGHDGTVHRDGKLTAQARPRSRRARCSPSPDSHR